MGELAARAEVVKLAHELGADANALTFLRRTDDVRLAALRHSISGALFAIHEPRLRRIAGLSKLLPPALSAKIAENALGPMLCGRIAGVLDLGAAVRLAGHLPPAFLAEVSRFIDPERTAEIVRALPEDLVLRVARVLLDTDEYIVLGRFVAVVDERVAAHVIEMASGAQLLQSSCYAEDRTRIDALLAHASDDRLADALRAAHEADLFDEAVSLLAFIGVDGQERLSRVLVSVDDPAVADGVVRAVVGLGAWTELLPVVGRLSTEAIRLLVNVPTTRDAAVISDLIQQVLGVEDAREGLLEQARDLGYFPLLVDVIDALDDEHRAVLADVPELDEPQWRAYGAALLDVDVETVAAAVESFRTGGPIPAELVDALGRSGAAGGAA
ncbi:MAG: hypothetical protein QOG80_3191 [Pseudonocardiales bacterium]|nr:hypothetical protein [Pseudonocardiales bacterium]